MEMTTDKVPKRKKRKSKNTTSQAPKKVQIAEMKFDEDSGKIICTTAGGKVITFDEVDSLMQPKSTTEKIENHVEKAEF